MPKIRASVVEQLRVTATRHESLAPEALLRFSQSTGIPLADAFAGAEGLSAALIRGKSHAIDDDGAQLWWVTKRMARLAAEARGSVPEWTPSAARPSRSGIVWWEGGTGIETPYRTTMIPRGKTTRIEAKGSEVLGCVWHSDVEGGISVTPIVLDPVGNPELPFGATLSMIGTTSWDGHGRTGFTGDLWPMLGATWLLAQSPTVGVTHGVRYDRRDPDRPLARPEMPSLITVVTLRETDRGAPQIDGLPRRGLDHQVIVRAHWRQQACGPKRAWRKPVFIAPHVRGPAGTELVVKPTVHVWRR